MQTRVKMIRFQRSAGGSRNLKRDIVIVNGIYIEEQFASVVGSPMLVIIREMTILSR